MIVLAALSIVGITVTQIYWVRRAFDLRENQFYRDVNTALRNVATQIFEINATPSPANNPVTQLSTNYFAVMINGPIDAGLLEFLLITEFEKRNISTDFEYGIYDCSDRCMLYGNYISLSEKKPVVRTTELPKWREESYYFGVNFPRLEANLLSQMGIWGFSSAVLLIVIFFFVYTLFVILKQRRLSEIQKDFINNMTHEFKTPISTIAISTEVLKDPSIREMPERLINYATIIENENNRLKQQVERVLQMARLDKENVALKRDMVDIHELIQEAIGNTALAMSECGGAVSFKKNASNGIVNADRLHIINSISNLIDNAIKYSVEKPLVEIRTSNGQGTVSIEVKDNGIGISPENIKKIFHRFYRVPTGNRHDVKGFGLGLNYVKVIVEGHKGRVSVESAVDKGSTFTIILPLA